MPLEQCVLFGLGQVVGNHFFAHLVRGNFGCPAEFDLGLGGVAEQGFDFGGTEVTGVDFDDGFVVPVAHLINAPPFPEQFLAELGGAPLNELAHTVLHAGGNYKVFGLVLLQHHPLHAHVIFGVAPVAQGVDVAHVQAVFQALVNVGQAAGDFSGDKGFATARAFVVEQDAVARIHAIGLAVVHRDPVGVELSHGVGAARIERRGFFLRGFLYQAVELAGTGLIKAGFLFQTQDANGFQNAQGAHAVHVGGVFWAFKADGHMALCAEVVDFVGLGLLDDARQIAAVAQVAVVQLESGIFNVRVLVDVVNTGSVEAGRAALDAVDGVTFFKQEFGEVAAILAGNAGDKGDFGLRVGVGVAHALLFFRKS